MIQSSSRRAGAFGAELSGSMNGPGIRSRAQQCVVSQALKPKSNKRGGSATAQLRVVELSGGVQEHAAAQWRVKLTEADGTTAKPNKVSGPTGQAKGIPTAKVAGINPAAQLSDKPEPQSDAANFWAGPQRAAAGKVWRGC